MRISRKGKLWSRDELIIVLDLYFRLPRGKFSGKTEEVIQAADLIDRSPAAVAKRLANYLFLDQGKGFAHTGSHARKLWDELGKHSAQVALEAAQARSRLTSGS